MGTAVTVTSGGRGLVHVAASPNVRGMAAGCLCLEEEAAGGSASGGRRGGGRCPPALPRWLSPIASGIGALPATCNGVRLAQS